MIDWHLALETASGDEALLADVLQAFQMEGPLLINQLRKALDQKDVELFTRAAHTLKGCLRSVGAIRSVPLAQCVEQLGREAPLDSTEPHVGELERHVAQILTEVADHLARIPDANQ